MARGRTAGRRAVARAGRRTATARGGAAGGGSVNKLLLLTVVLVMVPVSLPTMLVMFAGLLPTLAAAIAERGEGRYAWICVGGLNFAGLVPWLFDLWFGHHTLSYAINLLLTVKLYLSAYGAAAGGWLFYMAMPPVITAVLTANSQRRALSLVSDQGKLVEEWGEEVTRGGESNDLDDL